MNKLDYARYLQSFFPIKPFDFKNSKLIRQKFKFLQPYKRFMLDRSNNLNYMDKFNQLFPKYKDNLKIVVLEMDREPVAFGSIFIDKMIRRHTYLQTESSCNFSMT